MADLAISGTYRFERASSTVLHTAILATFTGLDDPAAKIASIEYRLVRGHEHLRRRRYAEALTEYRLAEGLLYSLAVPRFDPRANLGTDLRLPVDPTLFAPLAQTALTGVRIVPDPGPPVAIGPATAVTVPPLLEHYTQLAAEPMVLSQLLSDQLLSSTRDGAVALRAGEYARAIPLLERAMAAVPDDAPWLRSGIARNLGLAALRGVDVVPVEEDNPAVREGAPVGAAQVRTLKLATGVNLAGEARLVEIQLADADAHLTLRREVYERRVTAGTLAELGDRVGVAFLPGYFEAHIPHHYLYTVQMCLGDVYRALGQYAEAVARYERARDYQYLNPGNESPVVWTRIAECLVDWGYELYRDKQPEAAAEKFRQVVTVGADGSRGVPGTSPLYGHPPFAAIQTGVASYLANLDDPVPAPLTAAMAIAIRRAAQYLDMINAGLNILGLPLDLVPVFRFRYLQAVARYFTEQAIKAEREYITFMSSSEQETASQLQLQQSVDLASATVELESRRIAEAEAERRVAGASQVLAQTRVDNAKTRREEYAQVSADKVALDTASAHASGGFTETEGGYSVHLSTSGEQVSLGDQDYEIMRNAAWHRGMIQREFELADMARTEQEYGAHKQVADAQVALSDRRVSVAQQGRAIAVLRQQQAKELLAYAQSKTFDAALWHALADRMRELAHLYLERAIEIAYVMQAAYNFETDAGLDNIAMSYGTSDALNGLLGGQALMADIDYFTYHQVMQTRSKEIPVRTVLSLAEHFPYSLFQFRRAGVASFETTLELFDRLYPGTYLHRIKSVEVVVEGVVPVDGIYGSVRNSGVSSFRTVDNAAKVRLQPAETQVLSSYSARGDAVVFRPSDETRGVFEDSGLCTAWTVSIPPGANDLRYESISDLKLVVHHTAFHDPELEAAVQAALPTTGSRSRTFSLRESRPDAYFLLLETATASFDLTAGDFPYQQVAPVVQRIVVFGVAAAGGPASGLVVDLAGPGGVSARVTVGADGSVSSGGGSPLDGFVGKSPLSEWTVAIDRTVNAGFFVEEPAGSGVHRVNGIRDLLIGLDYSYTVRTGG
ncbi:MAG: hypothetical protein ACRDT2_07035 [Natronosporangium sp.]